MAGNFTVGEVLAKLGDLGYRDLTHEKLLLFRRDLNLLANREALSNSSCTSLDEEHSEHPVDSFAIKKDEMRKQRFSKRGGVSKRMTNEVIGKENIADDKWSHLAEVSSNLSQEASSVNSSVLNLSHSPHQIAPYVTKRKVMRKHNGFRRIFDETNSEIDSSDASDITLLEERLQQLPLKEDFRSGEDQDGASVSSAPSITKSAVRSVLPSYIYPSTALRNVGRCQRFDPVVRYHQLNKEWKQRKVPGESKHQITTWHIRPENLVYFLVVFGHSGTKEQMLKSEVFKSARRHLKRNDYQVPTEKKRQALRWEVRCVLANADSL